MPHLPYCPSGAVRRVTTAAFCAVACVATVPATARVSFAPSSTPSMLPSSWLPDAALPKPAGPTRLVAQASTGAGAWAVPGAPPVNGARAAPTTSGGMSQPTRSPGRNTAPQPVGTGAGVPAVSNPTGSTAPDADATGVGTARTRGIDATRAGIAVPIQQSHGTLNAAPQAIVTPGTPLGAAPSDMTGWRRGIAGGTNGPGIAPPPGAPDAMTPTRATPLYPTAPAAVGR